jgi:hypothetical protein
MGAPQAACEWQGSPSLVIVRSPDCGQIVAAKCVIKIFVVLTLAKVFRFFLMNVCI